MLLSVLMDAGAPSSLLDYISRGGVPALLLVILYGGFKPNPWWVFGWTYRDLQQRYERRGDALDRWWSAVRQATTTAEILAVKAKEEAETAPEGEKA